MSVSITHLDECQTAGSWRLLRRTLGVKAFGLNLVEIPPGEQIPEHDETKRDQEEVFCVISGNPTLLIDGAETPTSAGTFARLDPEHLRTVRNDSDQPARVLILSAPRTSGYQPMEWA
jgi:uncharacterized cupin superfamily protein